MSHDAALLPAVSRVFVLNLAGQSIRLLSDECCDFQENRTNSFAGLLSYTYQSLSEVHRLGRISLKRLLQKTGPLETDYRLTIFGLNRKKRVSMLRRSERAPRAV